MKKISPFSLGFIPVGMFLLLIVSALPGHALQIEINKDRLTVQADRVPLQDLLKQLVAGYDIILRMDPDINPQVTASFENRDLEDGLKSILRPYNHVLFWKSTPKKTEDSSAPAYRLDEIHVYRPGEKRRMIEINAPEPPSPQTPALVETNVIIRDNKVFVPVTLEYGAKEVETTLLFDTGAGSIVLHQDLADQLGIEEFQPSRGRGVGGVQITTKMIRLPSVAVGPHRKENLRADIVEFKGTAEADYNGLLGMNFIRGLKYTIDFENQTIRWMP